VFCNLTEEDRGLPWYVDSDVPKRKAVRPVKPL